MGYYQAMQLAQFLFSLSLVLCAFVGGMYVGWRRWGRVQRQVHPNDERPPVSAQQPATTTRRPDLFSPEVDLRPDTPTFVRGELTTGT
jgi:hypothetical protein